MPFFSWSSTFSLPYLLSIQKIKPFCPHNLKVRYDRSEDKKKDAHA